MEIDPASMNIWYYTYFASHRIATIIIIGSIMDGGEVNSIIVEADPAFVRFRDESRFWIQRVILIFKNFIASNVFLQMRWLNMSG